MKAVIVLPERKTIKACRGTFGNVYERTFSSEEVLVCMDHSTVVRGEVVTRWLYLKINKRSGTIGRIHLLGDIDLYTLPDAECTITLAAAEQPVVEVSMERGLERIEEAGGKLVDGMWEVPEDLSLALLGLTELPPIRSVGGGFYCYNNRLTSLEGAPRKVGGGFYCYDNPLPEGMTYESYLASLARVDEKDEDE